MNSSKVWYVTGASQGWGLVLVKRLLDHGDRVAAPVECFDATDAVEDVALLIPLDLRDRADDDAIGGDDVPALLDLQPRDRINH